MSRAPSVDSFCADIRGEVILPGETGYDTARSVWNGLFDKYPALIVQCAGVADVIRAVEFASNNDLLVSIKSGGHGYAGKAVCDDGMVIDLSQMDTIRVNPVEKVARVEAGARWGDVYHETKPFDLTIPGGEAVVGVGGFTLGGGFGYLTRSHGLTIDNLRSVDLVTADGQFVHVNEQTYPELFWGLRGGGGNFGVVTAFEYQLHEVPPMMQSGAVYRLADAHAVLPAFFNFMSDAPNAVSLALAVVSRAPDRESYPQSQRGEPVLSINTRVVGNSAVAREVRDSIHAIGNPIKKTCGEVPYFESKHANTERYQSIERWYSKSHYIEQISPEMIDVIIEYGSTVIGEYTTIALSCLGGAVGEVKPTDTAFPHRNERIGFDIWAGWSDQTRDEAIMAWSDEFHQAMEPFATGSVWANMLNHREDDRISDAYGVNYDRLTRLKAKWDPENFFRMNANIEV